MTQLGAERKDGDSARALGYLYDSGKLCKGCKPNFEKANEYYLKAIEWTADPYAAKNLAINYYWGLGTNQDIDRAFYGRYSRRVWMCQT
jgi:TPR repeat protein